MGKFHVDEMGNTSRHSSHVRTRCWAYIGGIGILLICWLAVMAGKAVGRASLAHRAAQSLAEQSEGSHLVLRNRRGIEVHLLRTGASIQRLLLPDRDGKFADVVLGFDEEVAYSDGRSPYFGAIVGRVANRIANSSFELDSATYRLATNERGMPGSLHGGRRGFDKVRWNAARVAPCASERRQGAKCRRGDAISMRYQSAAGEEGYPGTLDVEVTYTLTDADELIQAIRATTDAPTIINLAQVLRSFRAPCHEHAHRMLMASTRVLSAPLSVPPSALRVCLGLCVCTALVFQPGRPRLRRGPRARADHASLDAHAAHRRAPHPHGSARPGAWHGLRLHEHGGARRTHLKRRRAGLDRRI